MYLLRQYPQVSETYVQSEIDAVSGEFEVIVIAIQDAAAGGNAAAPRHEPYLVLNDLEQIANAVRMFRPQVLHTHWLISVPVVHQLAQAFELPFTVRAHSFDTLPNDAPRLAEWRRIARKTISEGTHDPRCAGVLAFPFSREYLAEHGARMDRVVDCFPCIDFARFHDRGPNGDAVMNVGACIPKKRMKDFLEVGASLPGIEFNLYPVSYEAGRVAELNRRMGGPVNLHAPVAHAAMPAVYKRHRWLLYTADWQMASIGWPLSAAEAQAAGVGVLLPAVRPDLEQYLNGTGYLYRSLDEAREIVAGPVPEAMREGGFENARRSDVNAHKTLLTDIWRRAIA